MVVRKLLLSVLVLLITSELSFAQQFQGVVKDSETKEPLVGATVYEIKTGNGTVTDSKGGFSIETGEIPAILDVSHVGYEREMITWNGDTTVLSVELKTISMEEIVIKGFRGSSNTPVTQKIVDKESIEEVYIGQDVVFLAEQTTPSLVAYSEAGTNFSNYGQMRLRGIDQTRINMTLDGVPLNDMIDQGVYFSNFPDFGNSIESFQVQRGVGTSTNGTSSYAGSINFESVRLDQDDPNVEIQLSMGSFNSMRGSAEIQTGRLKNDMAFYSRISMLHSDGYRYHSGADSYSFFFSGAHYAKKDIFKFTGFKGNSKNELAYLTVPESIINEDPRTNLISPNDKDEYAQWLAKIEHTHIFRDQLSIATTLYYGGVNGAYPYGYETQDYICSGGPAQPLDTITRFTQIIYPIKNEHIGLFSNVLWNSYDGRLKIAGGVHFYVFSRENQELIAPDYNDPYYNESSGKTEYSIFNKITYSVNDWSLYGDVQWRMVNLTIHPDENFLGFQSGNISKRWNFFNPKVGFSWQVNTKNKLYASFGRSGREPTKVDILGGFQLNSDNYPYVADSATVKPEFVNDIEIGYSFQKQGLKVLANFFYMEFENEIAPIGKTIAEGYTQLRENMASSYRRGVELDLNWQITPVIGLEGNATYMESNIAEYSKEDDRQVYRNVTPVLSPKWITNGTVAVSLSRNIGVDIIARYLSQSYLEPSNQEKFKMPDFFTLGSRISYQLNKHSIALVFNNITNQLYYTYGVPMDVDYDGQYDEPGYLVQPPFNMFVTYSIKL